MLLCRCIAVILLMLRQLHGFVLAQQEPRWDTATRDIVNGKQPSVGPLDDLEVIPPTPQIDRVLIHTLSPKY